MRYEILGSTGLRVSSVALGTGNFGTGWGYGTEREEAHRIYRAYREVGGNFLDTADQYQFGQSEETLAACLDDDRDDVILATKFSLGDRQDPSLQGTGNSRRAMRQSVEASLRRLRTDRIDLLWVHMPDGVTPIDEIMRGLDDLVRSGKILYGGLSDFPAWRVATGAVVADVQGWAPVAAIQIEYSLVERTAERELLPMAEALGIATLGWSPLGGGLLTGKYRRGEVGRAQGLGAVIQVEDSARKTAVLDALISVAEEVGHTPGQVALAWVRGRGVLPIIGPRTAVQLGENLAALDLSLDRMQIQRLNDASAFTLGVPHDVVAATIGPLFGNRADRVDRPAKAVR